MQMIRDNNWVLSVGTFLPMLGVIALLVTPKANEAAIKMVALLTSVATVIIGIFTLVNFDFDQAGSMHTVLVLVFVPIHLKHLLPPHLSLATCR